MGDPENYQKHLHPWIPETDPLRLAALGKLQEELGELPAAVGRCIIQGIEGKEEETGIPNREWLENEIADVHATLRRVIRRFQLDDRVMTHRMIGKLAHFRAWDRRIEEQLHGRTSEVDPLGQRAVRPPYPPGDGT
jgi:hypothetical protein